MTIIAINHVDENHLAKVMAEAERIGSVTLKAYEHGGMYLLLEGSHRIEAAKRLCIPVTLELAEDDDYIDTDVYDVAADGKAQVISLVEYILNGNLNRNPIFSDSDFEYVEVV